MDEWFVYKAAQFLMMSYADLDEHPRKHSLMHTAFTLEVGINNGMEAIKVRLEQEAKTKG